MKTVQVSIAGRDYIVAPLPIVKNREWRKQFEKPIKDAIKLLSEIADFAEKEADKKYEDGVAMIGDIGKAISGSLSPVVDHLLGSADTIVDAVFQYAPAMKEDREYIEENGYDDEIVKCFLSILTLAFPFGPALRSLMNLGREDAQTEKSSADPSSE
jgi:hypothetical protein